MSVEATTICCANVTDPLENGSSTSATFTIEVSKLTSREVLRYMTPVITVIVMIGIGCSVEIKKTWQYLKKPTGVAIGIICQFVIMPLLAYSWAKLFNMGEPETLSVLIVGSCPGGTFSNVVSYWIGADMELSVVMTFVSIIVSLGMIPLLLHIYTIVFDMESMHVPFHTIGITITLIFVPLAIGTAIRYKFPKVAANILKVTSVFALFAILSLIGLSIYAFSSYWKLEVGPIVTSLLFPPAGIMLGYILSTFISIVAKPLYLSRDQRKAISVETGIQNGQISGTVVQLAGWSHIRTARAILFILMYSVSQLVWCLLLIAIYHVGYYLLRGEKPERFRARRNYHVSSNLPIKQPGHGQENTVFEMDHHEEEADHPRQQQMQVDEEK